MECYLVQNGGGASLNFKVIGNPMPSTAKENTIWVDTDRINNYYFSATQPENMAEYDVWFTLGADSNVAFSATKKNPVMVYPVSAKQYVNGAWVNKTAKIWQGGKWESVVHNIFLLGPDGYDANVVKTASYGTHSFSANDSGITVTGTYENYAGGGCTAAFDKKYNLTPYSTLTANVKAIHGTEGAVTIMISTSKIKADKVAYLSLTDGSTIGEKNLDISDINGEYYILIDAEAYPAYVGATVDSVELVI